MINSADKSQVITLSNCHTNTCIQAFHVCTPSFFYSLVYYFASSCPKTHTITINFELMPFIITHSCSSLARLHVVKFCPLPSVLGVLPSCCSSLLTQKAQVKVQHLNISTDHPDGFLLCLGYQTCKHILLSKRLSTTHFKLEQTHAQ